MRPIEPESDRRIPSLDGWRALAILLVLGSHTRYTSLFPEGISLWVQLLFDGELGVRIFFVLSGYLISLLILKETGRTGRISLPSFFLRRIFRIFPVYFAYLGILAVLSVAGLYSDNIGSWLGCLTFTRNMLGRGQSGSAHFWSLAVEEQFYVVWPIMLSCLRLWQRRYAYFLPLLFPIALCPIIRGYLVSGGLGATLIDRLRGPRSILLFADSLAVGCIGAWLLWKSAPLLIWRASHSVIMLISLALLVGGHLLQIYAGTSLTTALVPSFQAWGVMGCLWLGTNPQSPGYKFLNSVIISKIGILSYSLYVWHFLFVSEFMGPNFKYWPTHDWRLWLLPAVVLSALSYNYLEIPFVKIRRKLHH